MPTKRAGRVREAWIVAGLAAAAAALTPALLAAVSPPSPPRPPVASAGEAQPAKPARPTVVAAREAAEPPDKARPRGPALTLAPPYTVADGLTILSETRRIRLAGLEGPAGEAACFDPDGRLWACGLQARAALYNLIRTQPVECRLTGEMFGESALAECSVGGARLEPELVRQGFARPSPSRAGLAAAAEDARSGGRGLWNGGWRVRP